MKAIKIICAVLGAVMIVGAVLTALYVFQDRIKAQFEVLKTKCPRFRRSPDDEAYDFADMVADNAE